MVKEDELLKLIEELQEEFRKEQDLLLLEYSQSVEKHGERLHQLELLVKQERVKNGE